MKRQVLWGISLFVPLAVFSPAALAQTTEILERGHDHQIVQTISPDGVTNTFVEMRTGLGRWSEADGGGWVLASLEIEKVNGVFLSRKTQYQAIFANDATASEGTIDLQMVNGARFRVRPMGLAYTEVKDGKPGRSVFVAELQASTPALVSSTELIYPGALNQADLLFRLSLAGPEQDVVIRRRLPNPQDLQMDPKLVRVECWSEVLESAVPQHRASTRTPAEG